MKTARILPGLLIVSLLVSFSIAPQKAHAVGGIGDDVHDIVTEIETTFSAGKDYLLANNSTLMNVKEFSLDPIAWTVAKMAIQTMTKSVVNWINSGFNGSPSFVTNFPQFMQQVSDVAAGQFITQLSSNGSIKSPFQSQVAQTTSKQYYQSTGTNGFFSANPYTLNKVVPNDAAFLGIGATSNFSQGGWSGWFSASQHPQNNPYGAQILAQDALTASIASAKSSQTTQLGWGQGFLSWCGSDRSGTNSNANGGTSGEIAPVQVTSQVNPSEVCQNKDGSPGYIQTPGSIIQGQVNKTLGLSGDQLVSADEFNEIIGALISQLTSQVLGATGLSGTASVSSGGTGYIDQATSPAQNAPSVNSIENAVTQSLAGETQQVTEYQTDWQTISTEANLAQTALKSCATADETASINAVLTQAQAGLTKAAAALTALQGVQADATAAQSDATGTALETVGQELQSLLAGPTIPSATDLSYAQLQSQDSAGNPNPTLYTQMEQLAATGCPLLVR